MNQLIKIDIQDKVAHLTLDRPEKRNALNPAMIAGLKNAFTMLESDDNIRVILLKATGTIFSAGADLGYLQQLQQNSFDENLADSALMREMLYTVWSSAKIVIAQVEGHAIAGGCGLVSVCDFVFATPEANFGYSEVKIGFVPAIVASFLVDKVGKSRASELLLSGATVPANTASRYGLVNFIAERNSIASEANAYAVKLSNETSAESIRRTKSLLRATRDLSMEASLDQAVKANAESRETADFKKGIQSFLEKQKLSW
ncbi:enoyl-CoA hydratase/isomerase family protein [Hufsiella ginkgonis]|uniref:Enoyl-CoA hydratase/isomerase family protein n=1 Tax=Hufsiella ginkgonis TaxID=2695274 RepID=A0A7K1XX19_9SPHI|nr:enoyl-CoA hydratase-related protein [Hufsiella ginkgonis]MXV15530.1 enoyl-CoA hydratase/isomerase family protein [Hufsiella ginkgonis]